MYSALDLRSDVLSRTVSRQRTLSWHKGPFLLFSDSLADTFSFLPRGTRPFLGRNGLVPLALRPDRRSRRGRVIPVSLSLVSAGRDLPDWSLRHRDCLLSSQLCLLV